MFRNGTGTRLVEELGCEGDAEGGGDEGDAAFAVAAAGVESLHLLQPGSEIRALLDQVPARGDLQALALI